ncbi:hypothetical protein [Streptomyces sp. NPDC091682]|uniref:hypothetical protein n=1 Tax=unclassified Streptomyces TaxID=2593676 RepID=UPI003814FAE0
MLDSTGGPDPAVALSKTRPGGLLVWFGQASRSPVSLDFVQLLSGPERVTIQHLRERRIRGKAVLLTGGAR